MDLYVEVYRATEHWPKREWYGLAAQVRGATLSAGSNLAEGVAKRGQRELARYVNIALGSLSEVSHQLRAAHAIGILTREEFDRLSAAHQKAGRLTWLLYAGIKRRLQDGQT